MTNNLRINAGRMRAAFDELAQIGATADGGVDRPSLSEAHLTARDWFRRQVVQAGLEFRTDGAGNHSAFLPCGPASAPALLLGSHLDSVPHGGRFDGALGVMAAFEALRTVRDAGLRLPLNLEAIDFTDEEGTLVGQLGSAALAGSLRPEHLQSPRGGREALVDGMRRAGLTQEGLFSAARPRGSIAGYLELHIEQGSRLERLGTDIGIVSAIVGLSSCLLTFIGRADHAGTAPMGERLDASLGASAFTLAARDLVLEDFPDCVVNIGNMEFSPGAFNIVPAQVDLWLEFRAPTADQFSLLEAALLERAGAEAGRFGLRLKAEILDQHPPTPMDDGAQGAFAAASDALELTHTPLISGAVHDAQSLAGFCPVGMIFVPSAAGASHAPREFTAWQDCVNGANVLLQGALRMAGRAGG
jgi:hydantoinase/carbamoylase family amidase